MTNSIIPKVLRTCLLTVCLWCGTAWADNNLFQHLGGEAGIATIVDGFLEAVIDDERIVHHFADANLPRLREKLIEQICNISGGPCEYTGDDMQEAHKGMNLNDADFNALVEDLQIGLRKAGVSLGAENRLIALLARMHADVVHR